MQTEQPVGTNIIGYVASEALEAVYYAIRENSIIEVRFEWVKYIVYFKNQGWYAGIIIKKKYEWPQINLFRDVVLNPSIN